jgi:hypothetical protein
MLKPDAGRKGKETHGSLRAAAGLIPRWASGSSFAPRRGAFWLVGWLCAAHQPRLGGVADARPVFPCLVRATMPVPISPPSQSRAPVRCASHRRGGWIDIDRGHQRSAPFRTASSTLAAGPARVASCQQSPTCRHIDGMKVYEANALWSRLTSHLKLARGLISRWFNIRPRVRTLERQTQRYGSLPHPSANPSASHLDLRTSSRLPFFLKRKSVPHDAIIFTVAF